MKIINSVKKWTAIIALSMLSPACTHETNSTPAVNHEAKG